MLVSAAPKQKEPCLCYKFKDVLVEQWRPKTAWGFGGYQLLTNVLPQCNCTSAVLLDSQTEAQADAACTASSQHLESALLKNTTNDN
jgi:hypothetical protein